jgi:hypothetical protein
MKEKDNNFELMYQLPTIQVCCNKAYEILSDEEAKLKVHVKGNHGISDIINDDMVQLCIIIDNI